MAEAKVQKTKEKNPLEHFDPNVLAALAYIIPPPITFLSGIAFLLIEKENRFVRFHSIQSLLFGIAVYAILAVNNSLRAIIIGNFLDPVLTIASYLVWLYLIWKAYTNEEYQLPFIGRIAKEQSEK